jgi:hypothetical protein
LLHYMLLKRLMSAHLKSFFLNECMFATLVIHFATTLTQFLLMSFLLLTYVHSNCRQSTLQRAHDAQLLTFLHRSLCETFINALHCAVCNIMGATRAFSILLFSLPRRVTELTAEVLCKIYCANSENVQRALFLVSN